MRYTITQIEADRCVTGESLVRAIRDCGETILDNMSDDCIGAEFGYAEDGTTCDEDDEPAILITVERAK